MAVVLVGTLDTKGRELAFVRELLRAAGLETRVIDAGSGGPPAFPADIDRERVFFRAGADLEALRARADRGEAVAAAARGVASIVADLEAAGDLQGVLAIGGSAGTTIGTAAMRALPFGIPKVMVSTLASGQTRPYVGGSDIVMIHSVADLAGLNRITRRVLTNAASAMAGMALGLCDPDPLPDSDPFDSRESGGAFSRSILDIRRRRRNSKAGRSEVVFHDDPPENLDRPVVAATMFGVTTPCVDRARAALEAAGCEVLVFHATGVGGRAMEGLIRDGQVQAVLDLTTTELADELVGGVLSAGPERLEAAVARGIPQVVSVGALDMVNFGPRETVPDRFANRRFHVHNPSVTLMRTTPVENAEIGRRMAAILSRATGPTAVLIPRGGVSALDAPGGAFYDPGADDALFEALRSGLAGAASVRLIERPEHINDPAFADVAASALRALMGRDGADDGQAGLAPDWATGDDVGGIAGLLSSCGLAPISADESIDGFVVVRGPDGRVVGCAGLEARGDCGLLRSVAVTEGLRGLGLGRRMVARLLNRAAAEGLGSVYLWTPGARAIFETMGFAAIAGEDVPAALADAAGRCDTAQAMRRILAAGETTP